MTKIVVIYHSGYGHTAKLAEAVHAGAAELADSTILPISAEGDLSDSAWDTIAAADGVIFGSPTYMGGPSWQFKKFADTSSKAWFSQAWKDKVAGGFTNSASLNGDKGSTIAYFVTLAMQQSMVWVGPGLMPASTKASGPDDVNRMGGYAGALATSPSDSSPDEYPSAGDRETGRLLGRRVAATAAKLRG